MCVASAKFSTPHQPLLHSFRANTSRLVVLCWLFIHLAGEHTFLTPSRHAFLCRPRCLKSRGCGRGAAHIPVSYSTWEWVCGRPAIYKVCLTKCLGFLGEIVFLSLDSQKNSGGKKITKENPLSGLAFSKLRFCRHTWPYLTHTPGLVQSKYIFFSSTRRGAWMLSLVTSFLLWMLGPASGVQG